MHSTEPSVRDVRIFGLLWPLFFGALAGLSAWRPGALTTVAGVLTVAWLVALVAGPGPFLRRLAGCLVPGLLAFAGGAVRVGATQTAVSGSLVVVGVLGALAILASPAFGAWLYRNWIAAAEPVGWTVSLALLALVYYAVVTPVGLALRVLGRDPIERRIDPERTSYWDERPARTDPGRYTRQF